MSDHDTGLPGDAGLPDLGGLLGGLGGGGGLGDLFAQAQQAMAASQAAADAEVEGSAGGGVVRIRSTGGGEVLGVTLAREVVDPDDLETLQDLIVAAFRDVHAKIGALHRAAMGDLDPEAMFGGLSGLLGGGGEDDDWDDEDDDEDE